MPDLLTPQTLASAGPILLDTLFRHFFSHKSLKERSAARGDDLLFDEAYILMKTFLESSTKHPISSLQKFGQVRTPAPPWVGVHRVQIPASTLRVAAEHLVQALGGPEMAFTVAGGSKWWQVRAGGLEGEWIAMKRDYEPAVRAEKERVRRRDKERSRTERARTKESQTRREEKGASGGAKHGTGQGTESPTGAAAHGHEHGDSGEGRDDGYDDGDDGFRKEMDEMRCMLYSKLSTYPVPSSTETSAYDQSTGEHTTGDPSTPTATPYGDTPARCAAGALPSTIEANPADASEAPQYPFPCAIQDCLAAWLYLTSPPPEAKHRPVKPEHIVIAGDSAGGGLVLALLQILRDTQGLELPAGAVLISPWSDLTHSFPSILFNTATDIVPPYSFIHKPSALWPPPPPAMTAAVQSGLRTKIKDVASRLRHPRGREASDDELIKAAQAQTPDTSGSGGTKPGLLLVGDPIQVPPKLRSSDMQQSRLKSFFRSPHHSLHPTTHRADAEHAAEPMGEPRERPDRANPADALRLLREAEAASATHPPVEKDAGPSKGDTEEDRPRATLANCVAPWRLNVQGEQVEIDTQVQIYATNAQLCHPLVSPALAYLGGLCPLFVMCGDKEVLRDEIIYLAHKAADPSRYPVRDDVRAFLPCYEGIEERYGPTKVHLQVYDGVCHDLPLFSMTRSARGVFRAITTFARYVTPSATSGGSRSSKTGHGPGPGQGAGSATGGASSGAAGDSFSWWFAPLANITPSLSRRGSTHSVAAGRVGERSRGSTDRAADHHSGSGLATPIESPEPGSRADGAGPVLEREGEGEAGELDKRLEKLDVHVQTEDLQPVSSPQSMTPRSSAPSHSGARDGASKDARSASSVAPPAAADAGLSFVPAKGDVALGSGSSKTGEQAEGGNDATVELGDAARVPAPAYEANDESGPRWGRDEDWDQPAKVGEAGHPSVYAGENFPSSPGANVQAWAGNMIRERVSPHGVLRPLEPPHELGALTMPADEIGTIKEGAAMRYLTGQYLWDKRYKRARKAVARDRERHLRDHGERDVRRIIGGVRKRMEGRRAERRASMRTPKEGLGSESTSADASGASSLRVASESGSGVDLASDDDDDDNDDAEDWSWAWALDGDVPPPSAIVSRRDTSEARQLALMADRTDAPKSAISGLSIWVALATFFSSSSERDRAKAAVKEAKAREDAEREPERRASDVEVDADAVADAEERATADSGHETGTGTETEGEGMRIRRDGESAERRMHGKSEMPLGVRGDAAQGNEAKGRRWSRVFGA